MIDNLEDLTKKVFNNDAKDILSSGRFGIEKESLRVIRSKISKTNHQESMGSPLCHSYITTDFSEAQLELITPPLIDKKKGLIFLENIHHFVSHQIEDEIIWPFSMPPLIESDSDIPIASYGSSNLALFKRTYRNGLSHRYGRTMQAISGIHFNYSLPEKLWKSLVFSSGETSSKEVRANIYFRTLRNLHRMNWLVLYLFGASPVASKNFLKNKLEGSKKLDNYSYYLPFATSLRMSDLGYQNINQPKLEISLNTLQEYIYGLRQATETKCDDFQKIGKDVNEDYPQINSNILQIEDEYYAVARPKSSNLSNRRLTTKLDEIGVDYIELRSLDINPFQRIGIDLKTVHFLEVFLIYCSLSPSPPMTSDEIEEVTKNDLMVATRGRKPGLNLNRRGQKISLKNWANQILDEMIALAYLMDDKTTDFSGVIQDFRTQTSNPELTLSAILLNKILSDKLDFQELGTAIGNDYKNYYIKRQVSKNSDWKLLENESSQSKKKQEEIEQTSHQHFKDYVKDYFSDSSGEQ